MRGFKMEAIRRAALNEMAWQLKYPVRRKKELTIASSMRIMEYCLRKEWKIGWNGCASFAESFPDGERLHASLKGGLYVVA